MRAATIKGVAVGEPIRLFVGDPLQLPRPTRVGRTKPLGLSVDRVTVARLSALASSPAQGSTVPVHLRTRREHGHKPDCPRCPKGDHDLRLVVRETAAVSQAEERAERREFIQRAVSDLHQRCASMTEGEPADYIPQLATVDPDRFAVVAITTDGASVSAGDVDHPFTIQSISKLLTYGLALETHGRDVVLERVGVAPTGDSFNAIVLDDDANRAPNPMVNAGAIAVTDLVAGDGVEERVETLRSMYERYLGRRPEVDRAVWGSERRTGNRNRAIAYLMLSRGIVDDRVEETLDLYFAQCSVLVTTTDLAVIGATIANHGRHPSTGEQVVPPAVARDMMTVALTCGMYDYAGEWAYSVGIPAKSGVGGGILGVLPGTAGVATFSPRLDSHGNSVRGLAVFEELSRAFDMHLFDPERPWYNSS